MNIRLRDVAVTICILVVGTALISITNADLRLSSLFCIAGKWPVGNLQPWNFLYELDRWPAIAMATGGVSAALIGCIYRQRRNWIRPGVFLFTLLLLGPGLIVNTIFKDYWGRPRPREVVQFGGNKEFLQPWQKGVAHKGRSFPSGHSSAAFYLSAPYFVFRRGRPRAANLWLAGGLLFGIFMSIARIIQGGHFLSDTLWAWGMVHICAFTLAALLKPDYPPAEASASAN